MPTLEFVKFSQNCVNEQYESKCKELFGTEVAEFKKKLQSKDQPLLCQFKP